MAAIFCPVLPPNIPPRYPLVGCINTMFPVTFPVTFQKRFSDGGRASFRAGLWKGRFQAEEDVAGEGCVGRGCVLLFARPNRQRCKLGSCFGCGGKVDTPAFSAAFVDVESTLSPKLDDRVEGLSCGAQDVKLLPHPGILRRHDFGDLAGRGSDAPGGDVLLGGVGEWAVSNDAPHGAHHAEEA